MNKEQAILNEPDLVERQARKFQKELNSGTVALLLLSIIKRADAPVYGYEITKKLQPGKEGKYGAIYPVLRNLHAKGLIECEVKLSENGPPRKYYQSSPLGEKVLEKWLESWRKTQQQVNDILHGSMSNDE